MYASPLSFHLAAETPQRRCSRHNTHTHYTPASVFTRPFSRPALGRVRPYRTTRLLLLLPPLLLRRRRRCRRSSNSFLTLIPHRPAREQSTAQLPPLSSFQSVPARGEQRKKRGRKGGSGQLEGGRRGVHVYTA